MNFRLKTIILLLSILFTTSCNCRTTETGRWKISVNGDMTVDIYSSGKPMFMSTEVSFLNDDKIIRSADYSRSSVQTNKINDSFGKGLLVSIEHTDKQLPKLTRRIYLYDNLDYLLTEIEISNKQGVSTNYISPIEIPEIQIGAQNDCRSLFVPFDNDKWIRYASRSLDYSTDTSYEVTSVFENGSRHGVVLGSIDHSIWKTAVETVPLGDGNVSLKCIAGVADEKTRDSKPHGTVSGQKVTSPKILLGAFDDWRTGMEAYADANATLTPPREWNHAVPFGWNSWGVLQFKLTAAKAMEVSNYIKTNLQESSFRNADNTVVVWLDSGWNNFTEEELSNFVSLCRANGQQPGIYWTPFTDWGRRPNRKIEHAEQYTFADAYLYANGQPQELDGAYAIDPTHPSVETRMKVYSELFRRLGFTYVKMDFMTHGAMEADAWYDKSMQTGMQAYNYGMALLGKYFGDMYINLSISPVFPAQYANSRRIACDAWGKIKDTEYTLNALSYGWWQDRIYNFNDADHIVLAGATEGENRARITSSVITGIYICGDDYSLEGNQEGKARSEEYLCNPFVNAVATGEAFRPVEGNGNGSECMFISHRNDKSYLAVFNYGENLATYEVNLGRLALDEQASYSLRELWRNEQHNACGSTVIEIPGKDVKLFEIVINRN